MSAPADPVVIVAAARTPMGGFMGDFAALTAAQLGSVAIQAAVARAGVDPAAVDDVLMGCANPEGANGWIIARQAALRAGLPITVSGATVNRFCSSGLQTIAMASQRVIAGEGDVYVAGGVESISCVQQEMNTHMFKDPWLEQHKPEIYWPMLQTAEMVAKPTHRDRVLGLLRSADVGVADAQVREVEVSLDEFVQNTPPALLARVRKEGLTHSPPKRVEIKLTHKADGIEPVALDFETEESAGTRRFFSLIGPWTDILDHGYAVFVDEIETSLHPILIKELLKLVLCNKTNPNGAQVVFTTHSPVLLDGSLMRRDQIWFTEKSPAGATQLYPLTDYQLRKDEALAKGYLAGRYGAIPFLPEGLKP